MIQYFEKLVRANFRYGRMRSCCCPLYKSQDYNLFYRSNLCQTHRNFISRPYNYT